MSLFTNSRISRVVMAMVLATSAAACSDMETLNKRSAHSGLEADKEVNGGGDLNATKDNSKNDPIPTETSDKSGKPSQNTTQQPTKDPGKDGGGNLPPAAKPCKYYDPAHPNFTIAKNEFGLNLPPRDMPSSQVRGTLQPDQKTFIGEFDLWLHKTKVSGDTWYLTHEVDGSLKTNYAYVITDANVETCKVTVRLVSQENRDGGGCFSATTQIRMADGSNMMIALLTVGDLVYNPSTRSSARVAEVVKGPEADKSMYEVVVGNRKVNVTTAHPFATTAGLKQAQHLRAGDQILAQDGGYEVVSAVNKQEANAAQTVVNIRLEGDTSEEAHMVLADGIVTGDLYLQRELSK